VQETLEYFANPDNLNSDVLPPGLSTWDPAPYLASAVPIAVSVVGVNFLHELGHRIAAFIRKVKLGPTYFVPNLQVRPGGFVCPVPTPGAHAALITAVTAYLNKHAGSNKLAQPSLSHGGLALPVLFVLLFLLSCGFSFLTCRLVPAVQIGSFGGITPFASLLKNRGVMWDVAAAGPIAGIAASAALLAIGLGQSHQGGLPAVSQQCFSFRDLGAPPPYLGSPLALHERLCMQSSPTGSVAATLAEPVVQ
jgi:hypothetical protein